MQGRFGKERHVRDEPDCATLPGPRSIMESAATQAGTGDETTKGEAVAHTSEWI